MLSSSHSPSRVPSQRDHEELPPSEACPIPTLKLQPTKPSRELFKNDTRSSWISCCNGLRRGLQTEPQMSSRFNSGQARQPLIHDE
ncbi:hypothetical protein CSHISOI_03635 [Colletotrichum shisoi]|uniref:Uncharacterized protein n=1 Tax=Colletotrichum shisoi TaxID=2078593 RepID=A0A5Q4C001_9PEZI|nr:hypothetical protein CSHISOI_03635 [Colletotrichum shisoi]